MAIVDRITEVVVPVLAELELELYDVEYNGGNLRITVDCQGGITLDQLATATRAVGRTLDENDPMPGAYTLEVSSPGVERRLRTSAHFTAAVGEQVSIKLGPHVEGERRILGRLTASTEAAVTVLTDGGDLHELSVADITKATTVFEWVTTPKPGGKRGHQKATSQPGEPAPETTDTETKAAAR